MEPRYRRLKSTGIAEVLTAPQSPGRKSHAERLIGSIRRECLNHFIILNSWHLKKTLALYFRYDTDHAHIWRSANNAQLSARS